MKQKIYRGFKEIPKNQSMPLHKIQEALTTLKSLISHISSYLVTKAPANSESNGIIKKKVWSC